MTKSLDDAIRENNAWENQRKAIDQKWATQVFGGSESTAPSASKTESFSESLSSFQQSYSSSISNYIRGLTNAIPTSGNEQFLRYRISHLKLLTDMMQNNPNKFFADEHDKALREALLEAANPAMTAYSSDYAGQFKIAAEELEKINRLYRSELGPML